MLKKILNSNFGFWLRKGVVNWPKKIGFKANNPFSRAMYKLCNKVNK